MISGDDLLPTGCYATTFFLPVCMAEILLVHMSLSEESILPALCQAGYDQGWVNGRHNSLVSTQVQCQCLAE